MRVLMVFVDGWGIGDDDGTLNPCVAARMPMLRSLLGGSVPVIQSPWYQSDRTVLRPLDATLGVDGLPQSGTGQTALFTGVNGAQLIGKHFGPYPYSTLRPVIEERNIFRQLLQRGNTVAFANAFPQRFFDYIAKYPGRKTVTTLSCEYAGVPLMQHAHLAAGEAVSADITGDGWKQLGYPDVGSITSEEGGRRLARLAQRYSFVLFEYWLTDRAGHSQNMKEAISVLENFDGMLAGIVNSMEPSNVLLVIISDHGNIEDLSTKSHTRNPVPLILYGDHASCIASQCGPDLTSLCPILVKSISGNGKN